MHWYLRYVKKTANRKACVLNLCTLLCVAAPLRTLRETVGVKHQEPNHNKQKNPKPKALHPKEVETTW
jgi:hypothetical protein